MANVCKVVFIILNVAFMIAGLACIGAAAHLRAHDSSSLCQKALQVPLFTMGASLLVLSLLGMIGSCCNSKFSVSIYSIVNFLLIVGLIGFTVFAFVVTNKGAGKVLSGIGYKDYRLGDYSNWLKNHFVNDKNWDAIRSCLVDAYVCQSLGHDPSVHQEVSSFYKKRLSPIQSGCCKPPTNCGFQYKNATFWEVPASGPAVADKDCTTWRNDQKKLCYDCNSCRGGVLANIKKEWRALAFVDICLIIILIVSYSVSSCTRKSLKSNHSLA